MLISIFTFLLLTLTLLGYRRWVWWFTLFDFFRFQYIVLSFGLLVWSIFDQSYGFAVVNLFTALINIHRIRHFLPRFQRAVTAGKKDLLSINAFKENDDFVKLSQMLLKTDPEVLLIMEVTDALEDGLRDIINNYEYRLQHPVRDGFSICLLSKHEMMNPDVTFHGPSDTPLLRAAIEIHGKKYEVFSAHPKPALNKKWYEERRSYFHQIIPIILDAEHPVIVLGDFNSVPWERHFTNFLDKTKLKPTLKDKGYKVTWPKYFLPMGIPMDHILMGYDIAHKDLDVGPDVNSDHYPISINIG